MYLAFSLKLKEDKVKQDDLKKSEEPILETSINYNSEFTLNDEETEDTIKSNPSLTKWCREHYINPRKMETVKKVSVKFLRNRSR